MIMAPILESLRQLEVGNGCSDTHKSKSRHNKKKTIESDPYQISLSQTFALLLLLLSALTSYHVGVLVRRRIWRHLQESTEASENVTRKWLTWAVHEQPEDIFEAAATNQPIQWSHCEEEEDTLCSIQVPTKVAASDSDDSDSSDDDDDEQGENRHNNETRGRHLLADVSSMDQDTIVYKLLKLSSSNGWTLKSHYCADDSTCFLVFQDGHYIILNKPTRQLDIFYANNDKELLDWLDSLPLVHNWALKQRGRSNISTAHFDAGLSDLYSGLLGSLEYTHKRLVHQQQSPFQQITIYDTLDPRIHRHTNGQTNEPKDRQLFLDGVVQSRTFGEAAYHEALVHPAMTTLHPRPQRVAIVGAGEGATLREVLKHQSVQEVVMIEIDPFVMSLSRQYLPEWNDCSDLKLPEGMVNPTGNCFDDPRATVYAKDAIAWFMGRYPANGTVDELFDVIIMDALDPGDKVEFSDVLFDNIDLMATFYRALSPLGSFVCQTGEQNFLTDPNPMYTRDRHAAIFVQNLGKVGFQRLLDYNEPSTRFAGLWSYLIASKALGTENWFANPAQVDLELQQRAMPTKSGAWPFHYYDGATQSSYQATSRPVADVSCLMTPESPSCQRGPGLFGGSNVPAWQALTREGSDLVAQQDLEPGTYVGLEECVHQTWDIPHSTKVLIDYETAHHMEVHMRSWKSFTFLFGAPAPIVGLKTKTVDMGNDSWTEDCRLSDPTWERFTPGMQDPMQDRYWRIWECAARRMVHKPVPAGSKMECTNPNEDESSWMPML